MIKMIKGISSEMKREAAVSLTEGSPPDPANHYSKEQRCYFPGRG
jgi:hypothetical protein